jgi:hypothetical protein
MGGGIPSTYSIPMSDLTFSSVGFPFGWNIHSGFGTIPSYYMGSNVLGGFNFWWVSTHFPGGTPPRGKFSQLGGYIFIHTFGPKGSSPCLVLSLFFLLFLCLPLGIIPLGEFLSLGDSTLLGVLSSLGETTHLEHHILLEGLT